MNTTIIIGNNRLAAFAQGIGFLGDVGYSHANEGLRDGIDRLLTSPGIEGFLPLSVLSGHEPLALRVMRKRTSCGIIPADMEDGIPLRMPEGTINRASARRALSEAKRALARAINEEAIGCQLDGDGNPVKAGRGRPRLTVAEAEARVALITASLAPVRRAVRCAPAYLAPVQASPFPRHPWMLRPAPLAPVG